MSGHGANPIFFNKKDKDWTSRTFVNPLPPPPTVLPRLIPSHFYLTLKCSWEKVF